MHDPWQSSRNWREQLKRYWKMAARVGSVYWKWALLIGFSLFIIEESLQVVIFATWQAPAESRGLHAATFRCLLNLGWTVLKLVGWLNPLAYLAYDAFFRASEVWYMSAYQLP